MADAYVTLASIQPSGSTQVETPQESKTQGGRSMKQGIYAEKRKNAVDSTSTKLPE
jgi:hypothetical protein